MTMARTMTVVVAASLPNRHQSTKCGSRRNDGGDNNGNGDDDGDGNSDGNGDGNNVDEDDNGKEDDDGKEDNGGGGSTPAQQTTINYMRQQKKWQW